MGRIQRKKPSGAKKKKKQRIDQTAQTSVQVADDAAGKKNAVAAVSAKETPKKQFSLQRKTETASSPAPVKQSKSFLNSAIQFLREVKIELKKVTWPSRKQTIGSTVVVIALVMLISLFLGVVDMGLSSLIRVVLQ